MNFSTHVLVGGVVGFVSSYFTGLEPVLLVLVGMIGGLVPELDFLYGEHRKALHFPFLYFLISVPILAAVFFEPVVILLAVALLSAGTHSFMDIFAGAELRSWNRDEWRDGAVYDHMRKVWISPRRIAYGGSRNDNLIALVSTVLLFIVVEQFFLKILAASLMGISVLYSIGIRWFSDRYVGEFDTLNQYVRWRLRKGF